MGALRFSYLVLIFGIAIGSNAFCCSAKEFLTRSGWLVDGRFPLNSHYGENFYRQYTNWKPAGDSAPGKIWPVVGRFYYRGVRALVYLHGPTPEGLATVEVKILAGQNPNRLEPLIARDLSAVQRAHRGISIPRIERVGGDTPDHFRIVFLPGNLPSSTWYVYGLELTRRNGYLAFPLAPAKD